MSSKPFPRPANPEPMRRRALRRRGVFYYTIKVDGREYTYVPTYGLAWLAGLPDVEAAS